MTRKEYLEIKAGQLSKEILLDEVALNQVRKEFQTLDEDIKGHPYLKEKTEEIQVITKRLIEKIQQNKEEFTRLIQELNQIDE